MAFLFQTASPLHKIPSCNLSQKAPKFLIKKIITSIPPFFFSEEQKIMVLRSIQKQELEVKRMKRTNRMLMSMVVIFGITWLPLNVINLIGDMVTSATFAENTQICTHLTHVTHFTHVQYQ
jgi:hypothetical protein